jgi:glycosyltransferase involved in cell wall biosynthesis
MIPFQGEVYNLEVSPESSYIISGYTVHNCQHEYGLFTPNLEGGYFAALKALGKPLVTTMHAVGQWEIDRVIATTSDRVITHNEFCARQFGFKSYIIPHGVSGPFECPPAEGAKKALGIDPRIPIVGYVGFISPAKGLERLVEAMAKVPKAALLIAGGWHSEPDTAYIMNLKRWSLQALPSRCQWLGYVEDEDLPRVYGAMDLVVYPSRWATESGALLMALSHGKAVIASSLPPFREKEKVGALTTFRDVPDLSRKIKTLLGDQDAAKMQEEGHRKWRDSWLPRSRLEAMAAKYARENCWSRIASLHLSLYESVLKA